MLQAAMHQAMPHCRHRPCPGQIQHRLHGKPQRFGQHRWPGPWRIGQHGACAIMRQQMRNSPRTKACNRAAHHRMLAHKHRKFQAG